MRRFRRLLIGICVMFFVPMVLVAQTVDKEKLEALQSEMYRLFYSEDSLSFYKVVGELKDACLAAGNEQVFYKAWGNHAIYESTHQRRIHALEVAREMRAYAEEQESIYGLYTSTHVTGSIYHQMRDYDNAEKAFLEAIDYLHKSSPDESAAADFLELALVSANGRGEGNKAVAYLQDALKEPHISLQHRLRALTMLCQISGDRLEPDRDAFNEYYEQRQQVRQATVGDKAERNVNWLYQYVNGNYQQALALADSLDPEQRTYARARVFHKMGDDTRAFEEMLHNRQARDSLNRVERSGLLSEYITQLSNERLELEKKELAEQNRRLRTTIIYSVMALVALLLGVAIYFLVRHLRKRNYQLGKAHQAEKEARIAEHEARQEAEKEVEIKREFLSNVAKELRSPLNPITGFSDILAATDIELSAEEREMMSQHIKENSKLLTNIIDHMVELSFYESAQSLPKEDLFSPNVLCQNAIDYTRMHLAQPGVEISFRTDIADGLFVKSDFASVDKVVRELLLNASKVTTKGGILLNCIEEDGRIRFLFTDTGPGIDPEHAKHIFEPFVQGGDNVKSTGMGLAICARIAKLLGGSLELDTKYRKGCRFIFEIPA